MTSIPANVQSFPAGGRTEQPRVQAPESKEDFSKVLDRQKTTAPKENSVNAPKQTKASGGEAEKTQEQTDAPQEAEAGKAARTEGGEAKTEGPAAEQNRQPETVEAAGQPDREIPDVPLEGELSGEELEQLMEILQSAILQIQELLTQQLQISPQELEQLMGKEGFTELQLLRPETVSQLILDAAGVEDPMALVTDENLYHTQQTITRGFQEITQELGRSLKEEGKLQEEGDLPKALESLENAMSDRGVAKADAVVQDPRQEDGQESGQEKQGGQERDGERDNGRDSGVTGQVFYQNHISQAQNQTTVPVSVATSATAAAYAEIPDSQQVMNQILDYMKVSMKPEDTVLDMQLRPENLGTLHIQITARAGVMTAHFTASSEAVKTVLENQMVVLKENFEQQDIKVDAIEVTVETHQFESNLEQGRQRGGEEPGRKPRRRRLDAGSLASGEELTEPDQILTEMMAQSGSSVDYLA